MQTVQVGRHRVYRRALEETKQSLLLYPSRKARRDLLAVRHPDPIDYDAYRSPGTDTMPGAPGKVSDPTGSRVIALGESHELAYLKIWVAVVDRVMDEQLSPFQREIIEQWVMVPASKRDKNFGDFMEGKGWSEREGFYRMNEALLEFALTLLGEAKVFCRNPAVTST